MSNYFQLWVIVFIASLLTACGSASAEQNTPVPETLFVSHYWTSEHEEQMLQEAIDAFMRINPDVTVVMESSRRTGRDFAEQANAGLGADMLVGLPLEEVIPLAEAGLLQELSGYDIDTTEFRSQYLNAVRYQDRLYALPFMGKTSIMYYHKALTSTVPADLDELLETPDEAPVGIPVNFVAAFWGTQAFGTNLLGEEENVQLDLQSYVDWFEWLKEARNQPGIILDDEVFFLREKFISGELAY